MILVHLLRIITALDKDLINKLDERSARYSFTTALQAKLTFDRYRKVPSFGPATIRRFSSNVSEMSNMAARNFEDLLQVCTRKILIHSRELILSVFYPCLRRSFTRPSQQSSYESPFHHVTLARACEAPYAF